MIGDRLDDPLDSNPVSSIKQQPSVNLQEISCTIYIIVGHSVITHKNQIPLLNILEPRISWKNNANFECPLLSYLLNRDLEQFSLRCSNLILPGKEIFPPCDRCYCIFV